LVQKVWSLKESSTKISNNKINEINKSNKSAVQTTLATTVTGGLLPRTHQQMPGTGTSTTITAM